MNEKTEAQIYSLAGFEPPVILAQMQWSYENIADKEACKLAGKLWGRKVKSLAYCWINFAHEVEHADRHQLQSLILIAGLKPHDRLELFEKWRDYTLSFDDVKKEVDALKPERKPREPKANLADKLQAFIVELEKESECGAGLELVCQRKMIADKLRELMA